MTGLVTNGGLKAVIDALVADDSVKYIAWGEGSGQDVTATNLASPIAESRTAGTMVAVTTNTTDDTLRVTGTITATEPRDVTEVGIFSAATGSVMKVYGDFPVVNLNANESIAFTIDVSIDQA